MIRKIHKGYRIACIAFGKRKVHTVLLLLITGLFIIAYQNGFDVAGTQNDIKHYIETGAELLKSK